ncbi:MAG TPA: YHYH protein [Pyrinomonadaceae bacterium]|nr:YHYH protein [Pyrinomonadaceae bacterium]
MKFVTAIIFGLAAINFILGVSACRRQTTEKTVDDGRVQQALANNPGRLPLGVGKISAAPRRGYVWSCQQDFGGGLSGIGAHRVGEWINDDGTWNPQAKTVEVDGDVEWDKFRYEIKLEGGARWLIGNGLPNHRTGVFPVDPSDDAYDYDRNPNRIAPYALARRLPANPAVADSPSCLPMGAVGVMKSGVVIFNALDAAGKDAVAHEIQDKCDGHPEVDNRYHYHNLSRCIKEEASGEHSALVGYALDGFGIFGRFGEGGAELSNAELDECHGHTHEIDWDGRRVLMYHYHATKEYPYSVGCFRGTPTITR